ncbi:hypothetical protein Tco_0940717 [Tanacetum coccineum]|uniref:Integrase, catalytic region, zinc finger, CCHC-type, peptidase aspartic, catalytic n=1 Tax=Tanacetum coccineum TaxID=301880 RepID=A0ABQ5DPH7_9ASTR
MIVFLIEAGMYSESTTVAGAFNDKRVYFEAVVRQGFLWLRCSAQCLIEDEDFFKRLRSTLVQGIAYEFGVTWIVHDIRHKFGLFYFSIKFVILREAYDKVFNHLHAPLEKKVLILTTAKSLLLLLNTLAEYMILSEHGRKILELVEHGPLIWPTVEENGVIRTKKYAKLSAAEKIQADCDMKAINIILQGLPADIYSLVNHYRVAKDLWERVQLLMQGTSLTKQERECKLYDAFDKFTHIKGETLHTYYLRFIQLINDMNIYKMKIEQFQVNTKFLNSIPPEWSKFVANVKLVKDLDTSNFYQLHAYLEEHELHANEVRIMRERNQDPLAFVENQ